MSEVSNWVYAKCIKCGAQRDFSIAAFQKKMEKENLTKEQIIENHICKKCLNANKEVKTENPDEILDELKPIKKDYKPFTKEMQLGKKPLKTKTVEETKDEIEDFISK